GFVATVDYGVLDEIDDGPGERSGGPGHGDVVDFGIEGNLTPGRDRQGRHVRSDLSGQINKVDWHKDRKICIKSLQVEQLVGQIGQARHVQHQPATFTVIGQELDSRLQYGYGGAQFMG